MLTTYHHIRRRGNLPSGWNSRTISPCPGALLIAGRGITFGLVFDAGLTYKQRQDARTYFERAARIQALLTPRKLSEMVAYQERAA